MRLKTKNANRKVAATRREAIAAGFRSAFEQNLADALPCKYEYESEVLLWKHTQERRYTPDLILTKKDGTKMYIEAKGRFYPADRTKMKYVKKQHPEKDIRLVFMNGSVTLSKTSKTTYMQWAERQGFPAHDCKADGMALPNEWLELVE